MASSMSKFLDNKTKKDDYYSAGINTGGEVADFSEKHFSFANKTHRFFHGQPVAAPAIILLSSIIVFGLIVGDRFFSSL
jgi:fructose transport system permease protein